MPVLHSVILDRVYLVNFCYNRSHFEKDPGFEYLCPMDGVAQRTMLEGPPDLGSVYDFCTFLEHRLQSTDREVALLTPSEGSLYSDTIFLIGAYIIMKLKKDLESTLQYLEPFTMHCWSGAGKSNEIGLKDYLGALQRVKQIGWVEFGQNAKCFDIEEYRHLDSPLNADLHEVVPGKLIMMRGPRDLPGELPWNDFPTEDGRFVQREFSPAHYADILEQLDVQAVVRCSAPAYDREGFEAAGIAVVDLCCEDDAAPPIDVVSKFLAVVERLPGAVAVHCGSGRGRSGTLAALYLMKHHGFTAREAMGWLRIVRPGW